MLALKVICQIIQYITDCCVWDFIATNRSESCCWQELPTQCKAGGLDVMLISIYSDYQAALLTTASDCTIYNDSRFENYKSTKERNVIHPSINQMIEIFKHLKKP